MPAPKVNIRPGVSVLSVLRYLNYEPWFALAEFVDNAVQSYLENKATLHGAQARGGSFAFYRHRHLAARRGSSSATTRAASSANVFPRAFRPAVMPPDRSGLSEFGMGMKSAACWFAPTWQVRTKALGETWSGRPFRHREDRPRRAGRTSRSRKAQRLRSTTTPRSSLENSHHVPVGRTIGKIKEHLTDIYRVFLRDGSLDLKFNGESLKYDEPEILKAPYLQGPERASRLWRKEIDFDFGGGFSVTDSRRCATRATMRDRVSRSSAAAG